MSIIGLLNQRFKVWEIRGSGVECDYQTGYSSVEQALYIAEIMNGRTQVEPNLHNLDGNPFTYVVREDN